MGGAPVGCFTFRDLHADQVVSAALTKIDHILTLGPDDPHITLRMLGLCANAGVDYYMRVTPPSVNLPHMERFDEKMNTAWASSAPQAYTPARLATPSAGPGPSSACLSGVVALGISRPAIGPPPPSWPLSLAL